jgi:GAF domain-containing protein
MMTEAENNRDTQQAVYFVRDVQTWQQQLVRGVLRVIVVVGLLAAAVSSYYAYVQQLVWLIPIYWVAYAIVVVMAFWRRVPYTLQVWVILGLFYLLALFDLATEGRGASGRLFLLTIIFVAGLFLGRREAIATIAVVFLTMVAFGWAYSTGFITDYQEVDSTDPTGWASNTFIVLMLGTFVFVSLNYLVPRLAAAIVQGRSLAQELEEQRSRLAEQVTERTADLERRSAQLEAAAQVARDAAGIQDVERLLAETVRLISDRFGFYHTGIFLLDRSQEYAVLRAASSEGGQRMLAQGHRLRVGEIGIVGYVTARGEPRIALDVADETGEGGDAVFFDNPDLPNTRSEMALPLQVRGEIIGALDVQSTEPGAFTAEDVAVLQTLADQVSMALSNARLFRQAQEALEAERRAYGELSRVAWQQMFRAHADLGFLSDERGTIPAGDLWEPQMQKAVQTGESTPDEGDPAASVAIPIKVRGQVIGVVDGRKPDGSGRWTPEEIEILETLTEQLNVALESARLYDDTQRRAARERLIGEVTGRMRETLDVDAVLQSAVREIRQALELGRVAVRLAVRHEDDDLA